MHFAVKAIDWKDNILTLLDQRALPHEQDYLACKTSEEVAAAIAAMVVRGAPAIAISAAFGMVLAAHAGEDLNQADAVLRNSRPTAVNLAWALDRLKPFWPQGYEALLQEALRIEQEDLEINKSIASKGAELLGPDCVVLTHCNTGSLATSGIGTALGIIRYAHAKQNIREVYASETRPWMQGARLTSWELMQEGIPVSLCTEAAVGHLMRSANISCVIVGADRVSANGDLANKIGTYNLAVLAKHHNIPFIAAVPLSTIDFQMLDGNGIEIEYRDSKEITHFREHAIAAEGVRAVNPAFDVTPASLIRYLVTEKGVIENPDSNKLSSLKEFLL